MCRFPNKMRYLSRFVPQEVCVQNILEIIGTDQQLVCHSDYGLKEMDTLPAEFLQGRSEFTFVSLFSIVGLNCAKLNGRLLGPRRLW